jgi:hypothetical protein
MPGLERTPPPGPVADDETGRTALSNSYRNSPHRSQVTTDPPPASHQFVAMHTSGRIDLVNGKQ